MFHVRNVAAAQLSRSAHGSLAAHGSGREARAGAEEGGLELSGPSPVCTCLDRRRSRAGGGRFREEGRRFRLINRFPSPSRFFCRIGSPGSPSLSPPLSLSLSSPLCTLAGSAVREGAGERRLLLFSFFPAWAPMTGGLGAHADGLAITRPLLFSEPVLCSTQQPRLLAPGCHCHPSAGLADCHTPTAPLASHTPPPPHSLPPNAAALPSSAPPNQIHLLGAHCGKFTRVFPTAVAPLSAVLCDLDGHFVIEHRRKTRRAEGESRKEKKNTAFREGWPSTHSLHPSFHPIPYRSPPLPRSPSLAQFRRLANRTLPKRVQHQIRPTKSETTKSFPFPPQLLPLSPRPSHSASHASARDSTCSQTPLQLLRCQLSFFF